MVIISWRESRQESFNFMKYYVITHSPPLQSCEASTKGYEGAKQEK